VASNHAAGGAGPIAVVGLSTNATCGVRDYAGLLADELTRQGRPCELHWLRRSQLSLSSSRSELRAWTRQLALELRERRPAAVLVHYSVFSYAYRGVPLYVRPVFQVLGASHAPIVTVLHELAYTSEDTSARGRVWALSQRAALREVMRSSAAAIVTAQVRASWLDSCWWLPSRPVLVAPVFSNLPPAHSASPAEHDAAIVGVFGYSHESAALALVLDAVRELSARGVRVRLRLLGAPGRDSASGAAWLAAIHARELDELVSFSGTLPAQELANALAACDVLLMADASGPSSRKTTLAASLATRVPVVAIDGSLTWDELVRSDAARVVQGTPAALADALGQLLADESARRALGERGGQFAERHMTVTRTAQTIGTVLERALAARG
jgi:glycosyltransferase involved in cell wall biosynthesis